MKQSDLKGFYADLDLLYTWMDEIYSVECPKLCDLCCSRDIIWMLLPELIRIHTLVKPRKVEYGCPYRREEGGCSIYSLRSLVCRSYGASQLIGNNINGLTVFSGGFEKDIAGPGVCLDLRPKSECDVFELNKIYTLYSSMSKWGLVAIGVCEDIPLQIAQTQIMKDLQERNPGYQVYVPDGVPVLDKPLTNLYQDLLNT